MRMTAISIDAARRRIKACLETFQTGFFLWMSSKSSVGSAHDYNDIIFKTTAVAWVVADKIIFVGIAHATIVRMTCFELG